MLAFIQHVGLKNFKKAKHYAEWIIVILKNNPSKVQVLCKLAGIV